MPLEEIVSALEPLWTGGTPSLHVSLQKAWAGREPIVKDPQGRLSLDVESPRLPRLLERLGLRAAPRMPPPLPEPTVPGPEIALTKKETDTAFYRGVPTAVSRVRYAAAILDVFDRPMTEDEILAALPVVPGYRPQRPAESPKRTPPGLVLRLDDGRLALNRASPDLATMRANLRELMLPALRREAELERYRVLSAEFERQAAAREVERAAAAAAAAEAAKLDFQGTIDSVQPRIRLTRSYDERSHSYLGYVLGIRGRLGGETRAFRVAIGKAAHAQHQFRVGDTVSGTGVRVENVDLETADLYKASALKVGERGAATRSATAPVTGVPPPLEEYRARGHRRLAALTYAAKCSACIWGCEMAVEMIIDPWKPSKRKYRRETFCYGPKSCPSYAAGPERKVPGRRGSSHTEEGWVDDEATSHREDDE